MDDHLKPRPTGGVLSFSQRSKLYLRGACLLACLICTAIGGLSHMVPSGTPIGPLARIFDSLAPAFLALAALLSLLNVILGARWSSALAGVLILFLGANLWQTHHRLSLPLVPERTADMRILFFNALHTNEAFSHRIVAAVQAENPDVVVFAEGKAIYPALRDLQKTHRFLSPCIRDICEILVAAKKEPERFWRLSLNPIWPDRYAVTELLSETGKRYFVAASQVVKPWFSGVSESEMERLGAQYDWLSEPVIAVGDFNAAPWSRPMQDLLKGSRMRALRRPPGTWPSALGRFGVPIDQILVHNGARVVAIRSFGLELNSNHLGFVADIALPDPSGN